MENLITVTFPGGKKVNAEVDGRVVSTDQPVHNGGEVRRLNLLPFSWHPLARAPGFMRAISAKHEKFPFKE